MKFGIFGICGEYAENGKNMFIEKILMVWGNLPIPAQ
jgi:hypothetical protein